MTSPRDALEALLRDVERVRATLLELLGEPAANDNEDELRELVRERSARLRKRVRP